MPPTHQRLPLEFGTRGQAVESGNRCLDGGIDVIVQGRK